MSINRPDSKKCPYCERRMRACGIPSHIHFKHLGMVLLEFRSKMANPFWQIWVYGEIQPFPLQLTNGNHNQEHNG